MRHGPAICLYSVLLAWPLLPARPASAQFMSGSFTDPAIGERYFIEAGAGLWAPSADIVISSEGINIPGSEIDFRRDLGLADKRFGELRATLRPSRKQKLRFQYIPIKYEQETVVTRDLIFNGQRYRAGLPVNSLLDWAAYRFAYEYDAFYRSRGFIGFVIDLKYTDVRAELANPVIALEFARAAAPIPSIGGIGRYYVLPNVSVTAEITGIKIPDSISEDYRAHYVDVDLYGTVNFTNHIGAQLGYRSFDVGYKIEEDTGSFVVKGLYFGLVARY
ncbi:MAG: hypothetical protein GEU82_16755 [Luteitalea sp.]|nr:hypothetical protein [Luteitalea sp.]